MNYFLRRLATPALLIATAFVVSASAQPTNEPRGTICVTPSGWCKVEVGPPGSPCSCPTPTGGWAQGTRR